MYLNYSEWKDIPDTLKKFEESDLISGHYYVQVVTYMKEMCNSLEHIVQPAFDHVDNNHSFDKEQTENMKDFNEKVNNFFNVVINLLKNKNHDKLDELVLQRDEMINMANEILLNRIKILKKSQKGVKVSVTYMEMLSETKSLLLNVFQLVKADVKLLESFTSVEQKAEIEILD